MIEEIVSAVLQHWLAALTIGTTAWLASNYFKHGLYKYPGPLLASLTDWWRFLDVYGRRPDITQIRLHKQHGDIVRLGPNCLSFADPKALKEIYGLKKGYTKSEFYPVQQALSKGDRVKSLFSTTDEAYHARLRRCVNGAFSMSALIQYEPSVDIMTERFLDQTNKLFASKGAVCDFAEWLQFYAFDVIGQITYSKSHGFVDRGEDVDGMVGYLGWLFSYVAPIGQIPFLDLLFLKNPILRLLSKYNIVGSTFPVVTFAQARMSERLSSLQAGKQNGDSATGGHRGDLLSQFLKAKDDHPDFFDDSHVLTMSVSMAFAGSETTAISLTAVFYYLLKNPRCMARLRQELTDKIRDGTLSNGPTGVTSWSEAQQLPYLDACIKEAFRLHPAAGLPLERVTPPQGATICGQFIPGGTIVGCNAWVIHRRPELFGEDVDAYKPERWLECEDTKRKEMEGGLFQFGMGSRTCIGKNISLLEIYKLVPSFLRRFEIELAHPEQEWKLHNAWFVKQLNFHTKFRPLETPALAPSEKAV